MTTKKNSKVEEEIKKLLSAKTPEQYVDKSVNSKLNKGQKGTVTKLWLEKTGYASSDIQFARNRHPYWKKLKMKGGMERTYERLSSHDYRKKGSSKEVWTDEDLKKFLKITDTKADWELAKEYKTTLPAINHIRRKIKLANRILTQQRQSASSVNVLKLIKKAEAVLKKEASGK